MSSTANTTAPSTASTTANIMDSVPKVELQGRLAGINGMGDDPRMNPRVRAAFVTMGMAGIQPAAPVNEDSPVEAIGDYMTAIEGMLDGVSAMIAPPERSDVDTRSVKIEDGNVAVEGFFHTPKAKSPAADGTWPAVLSLHGGGMCILTADNPLHKNGAQHLASTGLVVLQLEFSNTAGKRGRHAFPKAHNEVVAAVKWLDKHKTEFKISKIILAGASGGCNLAFGAALALKREGQIGLIGGIFASCPFIGNLARYGKDQPPKSIAIVENDGFFLDRHELSMYCKLYDPEGKNTNNPLAFPLTASDEDLTGLPPVFIAVQEMDMLREEGIEFHKRLLAAGVVSTCVTHIGLVHNCDLLVQKFAPEVFKFAHQLIRGFVGTLDE